MGGLYHATPDGGGLQRIASGISLNGVAIAPDGNTVYAAATHERWLLSYDVKPDGRNQHGRVLASLPGRRFLDSMALEAKGTVAVGCIGEQPGIARIDPATSVVNIAPMPDSLPTNIASGGADMCTGYITLSERGILARCAWPAAGARLPFNL